MQPLFRFSPVFLLVLLACNALLPACQQQGQLCKGQFEAGWPLADSLVCPVENQDLSGALQVLRVFIEVDDNYPTSNLYLDLMIDQPNGQRLEIRNQYILMDSLGNWYEPASLIGGTHSYEAILTDRAQLTQAGTYIFTLAHAMRYDTLPGIRRVSLGLSPRE